MDISFSDNKIYFGTWLQSGSATIAEILADYGLDFIALDMEHTDCSESDFTSMARAIEKKSMPMARVRENNTLAIRRVLDCGAKGVIVPLVSTKAEAEYAVAAAKYPPRGIRGYAFVRANEWGHNFDDYALKANDETMVIIMIENRQAVESIDDLLSVDGVDGALIGPYDLSGSYGLPGQTDNRIVIDAKRKVLESCRKHNKLAGQHIVIPTEENVKKAIEEGYRLLALGMDTVFVSEGARRIVELTKR